MTSSSFNSSQSICGCYTSERQWACGQADKGIDRRTLRGTWFKL